MELNYVKSGDHLLPALKLSDLPDAPPIGRYGKMRRAFLKEHAPITYSQLLLTEQLFPHLREVDAIADERRKSGCSESQIVKEIICEL
ncbi:MAG: TnpV protein [Clostridiales bacterium]|nr:TnpV protein [Clostridiales bacterium]